MSDISTMVVEKRGSPLDRLAPELIVNIVSQLPTLKSVLAFGLTSHKNLYIIAENEGTIARNMAAMLLDDDDPEVVRLAFLACKATLIEQPDARRVRKFIRQYVSPGTRQSHIYQFRALALMRDLSVSVELLLDWTATYATVWPLKSGKRVFTATEVSRMKQIIYLAEAGIRLLCTVPKPALGKLADKFWRSFPLWDVDRAYAFMKMITSSHWCCNDWSLQAADRGPTDESNFPWHAHDELRHKLYILHFSIWQNTLTIEETDTVPFPTIAWTSYQFYIYFNRRIDPHLYSWTGKNTWYSGLDRDEIEWSKVCGYFDPGVFNYRRIYDWFFMIADEDRRQRVINQGLIWSWLTEPEGEQLWSPDPSPAEIVWHENPARFGWKGTVGTPVPVRDIIERRYIW